MSSARALGWGQGWPHCKRDEIVTVVCGVNRLRLPVRQQIAPLVAGLVTELEAARRAEAKAGLRPDWSWGFACRPISGTRTPSNHSQGCAVDLDAPQNPYLPRARHRQPHPLRRAFPGGIVCRSTMPLDVQAIAERWGFAWGGRYYSKPDPMHFEIALTPTGAATLIADLRALAGRPIPQEADMALTQAQFDELAGNLREWIASRLEGMEARTAERIEAARVDLAQHSTLLRDGLARVPRRLTHGVTDGSPDELAAADEAFADRLRESLGA